MPKSKAANATRFQNHPVADAQLAGDFEFPRVVVSRDGLLEAIASGLEQCLTVGVAELTQQGSLTQRAGLGIAHQRNGEVARDKTHMGVETDVIDGSGHGLQTDRGRSTLSQPA